MENPNNIYLTVLRIVAWSVVKRHNLSLFFVAVLMNLTISNVNGCAFLNSCIISYVDALLWGGGTVVEFF